MFYVFDYNLIIFVNLNEFLYKLNNNYNYIHGYNINNKSYVKLDLKKDNNGYFLIYKKNIKKINDFSYNFKSYNIRKMSINDFILFLLKESNNFIILNNFNSSFKIVLNKKLFKNGKLVFKSLNDNFDYLFSVGELFELVKYNYFNIVKKDNYKKLVLNKI